MNPSLRRAAFAVLAAALLVLTACSSASSDKGSRSAGGAAKLQGTKLGASIAMPTLTLTDSAGQSYDLKAQTKGKVTLVYFGYTHCPDECPTMMADLAEALRTVPAQVRTHVTVVFITSDPARDSAPVMKKWLAQFNPAFVGLTGNIDTIYAAAEKVGIPLEKPPANAHGNYEVTHGTQLLAFGPDQTCNIVYTDGTPVSTYEHDLPLLTESAT